VFGLQGCEDWGITSDGKEKADMTTEMIERILSKENLEEAKCKVMSNKGSAGVDRMKTSELPKFIDEHGEELCEAIRRRKYKPLPVRRVEIPKEDGSKRNLGVPAVKDRWIEQAVCQVLTPIFEKEFSENSYGFRPGRKAEQAVIKALEFMNDGYDWIVDNGYEPVIICTKLDKIKRSQVQKNLKLIREKLDLVPGTTMIPFSAQTKQGRDEIWNLIEETLAQEQQ